MPSPPIPIASPASPAKPRSQVAHYRITAKVGEGGMGAVYRANTNLNCDVATKV